MLKQLAVFYLFFSLILFTSAVPSSRSLISSEEDTSVPRLVGQVTAGENHAGGALIEGRLDFELEDYPPTGASSGHDPQVPGPPPPVA